jgi:peptidyl-prolyl cis-trans isomerase SurA
MTGFRIISRAGAGVCIWLLVSLPAGAYGQVQVTVAPPLAVPAASAPSSLGSPLVVLDHVVAVINGNVILESDIKEELRFAVLQPDRADPARNTPERALERLIDRALILQQIQITPSNLPVPTDEQVHQQLSELRKLIPDCAAYHCDTDAGWNSFLAAHGLTEAEVVARWRQRMFFLSFIQSRFAAGVHITQPEIEQYYDKEFVPEFGKRHLKPPPLNTVASRIHEILLQRRINGLLQEWLQSMKDSGNVNILSAGYNGVVSSATNDSSSGAQR